MKYLGKHTVKGEGLSTSPSAISPDAATAALKTLMDVEEEQRGKKGDTDGQSRTDFPEGHELESRAPTVGQSPVERASKQNRTAVSSLLKRCTDHCTMEAEKGGGGPRVNRTLVSR